MKQNNKPTAEMPQLLSAKDMSEHLGVSLCTCYKLLKQDDFPVTRIGKRRVVTREHFTEWLKNNTTGGKNNG
ncbi:helix-turn-helix domain-containing protein [Ruminococcus flavefaciens]|uniref:Transcriptional regulator, AlpA family n=1 Tax=Ruminococcus flavefaciens TaxID=1265 RepID=A0A1K1MFH1_RUMFL|nr:helix-turn-helix domain-containing protein [Ruminococcus flavefaciens]SFW21847.1 transcriptional regulator, AlpA family [Ruminococcus flavefaciens]